MKFLLAIIFANFSILSAFGSSPHGTITSKQPLVDVFTSLSKEDKFLLSYSFETYLEEQSMDLNDGSRITEDGTHSRFLNFTAGYTFYEDFSVALKFEIGESFSLYQHLSFQYDAIRWNGGKLSGGLLVGNDINSTDSPGYGAYLLFVQSINKSTKYDFSLFLSEQYRNSEQRYADARGSGISRTYNTAHVETNTLSSIVGIDCIYDNQFGLKIGTGWQETTSFKVEAEEATPTNYNRKDGMLFLISLYMTIDA